MTPDGIVTVITIVAGFAANIFFSGKWAGRIEADIQTLRDDVQNFRAKDFITRAEYENRHREIMDLANKNADAIKRYGGGR